MILNSQLRGRSITGILYIFPIESFSRPDFPMNVKYFFHNEHTHIFDPQTHRIPKMVVVLAVLIRRGGRRPGPVAEPPGRADLF